VALVAYWLGSAFGLDTLDLSRLAHAFLTSPVAIVSACLTAVGEEVGWRGFLWPLLRRRRSFLATSLIVWAIWCAYHVPLILLGWYGTRAGIAAFTVAVAGIVLFIGVLTDRSRSVWPSVAAHGAWNGLVATGFAVVTLGGDRLAAFTGSTTWVGEFGWLAAFASLALGVIATVWHLRRPEDDLRVARPEEAVALGRRAKVRDAAPQLRGGSDVPSVATPGLEVSSAASAPTSADGTALSSRVADSCAAAVILGRCGLPAMRSVNAVPQARTVALMRSSRRRDFASFLGLSR